MADKKISQLPDAGTILGDEVFPFLQGGSNVKGDLDTLKGFVRSFRGDFNASGNVFPATGGTGIGGAIAKGDEFDISVSGTLGGEFCPVGTTIRARQDAPGNTLANWRITF